MVQLRTQVRVGVGAGVRRSATRDLSLSSVLWSAAAALLYHFTHVGGARPVGGARLEKRQAQILLDLWVASVRVEASSAAHSDDACGSRYSTAGWPALNEPPPHCWNDRGTCLRKGSNNPSCPRTRLVLSRNEGLATAPSAPAATTAFTYLLSPAVRCNV